MNETFAEHHITSVDGVRIRYRVQGAGTPVLLLHGFSDACESWWQLGIAPTLARRFRVIAPDARGHGDSDKPIEPSRYGDPQRVGDVLAVLDACGAGRAHLVGYSMGGWTAMAAARLAPGRVRSLLLGGAHPYGQSLAHLRTVIAAGNGTLDGWLEALTLSWGTLPEGFDRRFVRNDPRALAAAVAADRPDVAQALRLAELPALWFAGERDPARPLIERAASACLVGRFTPLPDRDHFNALGSPALPHLLLEFLLNQPPELAATPATTKTTTTTNDVKGLP